MQWFIKNFLNKNPFHSVLIKLVSKLIILCAWLKQIVFCFLFQDYAFPTLSSKRAERLSDGMRDVLTCETYWLDLTRSDWENLNVQVILRRRQSFIHSIVFTFLSVFCSLILYCLTIADLLNDKKIWIDQPITSFSSHFNLILKMCWI